MKFLHIAIICVIATSGIIGGYFINDYYNSQAVLTISPALFLHTTGGTLRCSDGSILDTDTVTIGVSSPWATITDSAYRYPAVTESLLYDPKGNTQTAYRLISTDLEVKKTEYNLRGMLLNSVGSNNMCGGNDYLSESIIVVGDCTTGLIHMYSETSVFEYTSESPETQVVCAWNQALDDTTDQSSYEFVSVDSVREKLGIS